MVAVFIPGIPTLATNKGSLSQGAGREPFTCTTLVLISRDGIKKMKRQTLDWEKILAKYMSNKDFYAQHTQNSLTVRQ